MALALKPPRPPAHLPTRNTAFIYIIAEFIGGAIAAILAMML